MQPGSRLPVTAYPRRAASQLIRCSQPEDDPFIQARRTAMNMRMKTGCVALLWFGAVGCVMQANAASDAAPGKGALTFTVDNDVFTGSDNNYTNGLGVTWVSADLNSYDDDRFVSKW